MRSKKTLAAIIAVIFDFRCRHGAIGERRAPMPCHRGGSCSLRRATRLRACRQVRCRFTLGTFFFDLSSVEERAAIWKICASALRT
jgi:hypothetical protein